MLPYCSYVGTLLATGKKFDSIQNPNKPFEFVVGRGSVIQGLDIGLKGLRQGGKRIIVIPPDFGYGSQVLRRNCMFPMYLNTEAHFAFLQVLKGIPMNSTLKFKIELLEVGPSNESAQN